MSGGISTPWFGLNLFVCLRLLASLCGLRNWYFFNTLWPPGDISMYATRFRCLFVCLFVSQFLTSLKLSHVLHNFFPSFFGVARLWIFSTFGTLSVSSVLFFFGSGHSSFVCFRCSLCTCGVVADIVLKFWLLVLLDFGLV